MVKREDANAGGGETGESTRGGLQHADGEAGAVEAAEAEPIESEVVDGDAGPARALPTPIGSGEPAESAFAVGVVLLVGVAFTVVSVALAADKPLLGERIVLDVGAGGWLALVTALMWLYGRPGFNAGKVRFLPASGLLGKLFAVLLLRIPSAIRDALLRLTFLPPLVGASAALASLPHTVGSAQFHAQLEPSLLALLTAAIAINGFLSARQHTIDFVAAVATVVVLSTGAIISLTQISHDGKGLVHWTAAAGIFGLISIFLTGLRAASE